MAGPGGPAQGEAPTGAPFLGGRWDVKPEPKGERHWIGSGQVPRRWWRARRWVLAEAQCRVLSTGSPVGCGWGRSPSSWARHSEWGMPHAIPSGASEPRALAPRLHKFLEKHNSRNG